MLFWHLGLTVAIVYLTLGRRRIDYRVVLLGSILPDLVDKPVGRIFFSETFQSSHLFGHTLLFSMVLLGLIQLFLRGAAARRWFILPISSMLHLVLDGMWGDPITLFWPLFTTHFPRHPMESYWLDILRRPFAHPVELLKELVGLGVLLFIAYAYELHKKGPRGQFVKTGRLGPQQGADLT